MVTENKGQGASHTPGNRLFGRKMEFSDRITFLHGEECLVRIKSKRLFHLLSKTAAWLGNNITNTKVVRVWMEMDSFLRALAGRGVRGLQEVLRRQGRSISKVLMGLPRIVLIRPACPLDSMLVEIGPVHLTMLENTFYLIPSFLAKQLVI